MDALERLQLLSSDMDLEPAEDAHCPRLQEAAGGNARTGKQGRLPVIHEAVMPGGKRIRLLKSLLTSACERNCYYCPFRAGRDFRRETFKPHEMADTFMDLHRAGIAEGLFLSSGVAGGGIRTQDRLLDTAEILRRRGYQGYLHLKLMPGSERDQVLRAMQLADRVSINLEAPNPKRLELLAPGKNFMEELLEPLRWVAEIRRSLPSIEGWKGLWPSMTTQFVVGGAGETDLEIIKTTEYLIRQLHLQRAYFSAFRPIAGTPLENLPREDPLRQLRLYQASFLLRDYNFEFEDLPFDAGGRLPVNHDPKWVYAQANLLHAPVEINRADRVELLRIPGIGPRSADAILRARRSHRLKDLSDLRRLGIVPDRAAPYMLLDGKRPAQQLSFWALS